MDNKFKAGDRVIAENQPGTIVGTDETSSQIRLDGSEVTVTASNDDIELLEDE